MLKPFLVMIGALATWMVGGVVLYHGLLAVGVDAPWADAYSDIVIDTAVVAGYVLLRRRWPDPNLFPLLGRRAGVLAAWSLAGAVGAYLAIAAAVGLTHGATHVHPGYDWQRGTAALYILMAAAFEEVLVRGCLYAFLRRSMGIVPAVVIAALLFALMHGRPTLAYPLAFVSLFAFAAALSTLCLRFDSLVPAILAHAVFNYFSGLTGLDLPPPLDHPGVLAYENGTPDPAFTPFQVVLALLVIGVAGRQALQRSRLQALSAEAREQGSEVAS